MLSICACSASFAKNHIEPSALSDVALWHSSIGDGAFNELRCQGLSANGAKRLYRIRFSERERRIAEAIRARYGDQSLEEIIPIGHQCRFYRGAVRAHERRLRQLEFRLDLRVGG